MATFTAEAVNYVSGDQTYTKIVVKCTSLFLEERVTFYVGGNKTYTAQNGSDFVDHTYTVELYASDETIKNYITPFPKAKKGKVTIVYENVIWQTDGSYKWEEKDRVEVEYDIVKNQYTAPQISSFTLESVGASAPYYMKGESQVKATFGASAKCGASISKYSLTVSGSTKESTTSPVTSDTLSMSGVLSVTGTVTDSRGFTATKTETINVLAVRPTLDLVSGKSVYVNDDITCKYTPANDITYSRIWIYYVVGAIVTEITHIDLGQGSNQQSRTFNLASLNKLSTVYNAHPKTKNVKLLFQYDSYFDSGYIERLSYTGSKELTLEIPCNDDTKPSITGITRTPVPVIVGDETLYMKGKNSVKVKINSQGKYKATIQNAVWTLAGKTYQSELTSDILAFSGNTTIQATVTDSRGFTCTETVTIDVLDYSKPTMNVNAGKYFDEEATVTFSLANNRFRYVIEMWYGNSKILSKNPGQNETQVKIAIDSNNLGTIYRSLPNGTKGEVSYRLVVYTDPNYQYVYDNNITKSVKLEIPENEETKPQIKSFDIYPYDNPSGISVFINKKSKARISTNTFQGQYGATISKCVVTLDGMSYEGNTKQDIYSGYLASAGSIPVRLTITDTRNFTRTQTKYITVSDYFAPYVGAGSGEGEVVVKRWSYDEDEQNSGSGSMLKIVAKKVFASVAGQNKCSLAYQIKAGKDGEWSEKVTLSSNEGALEYNGIIEDAGLDAQAVYYVNLLVKDSVDGEIATTFIIPTERVFMDRSRTLGSIAFGGHATEENAMQVYFDAFFYGDVQIEGNKNNRIDLGLASGVSPVSGGESGCFVKRSFDGKITVSFRCSLNNTSGQKVNKDAIPTEMRPTYGVNAFCTAGQGNYIAACSVTADGLVKVKYVCDLSSGATVSTVGWVEGYIEYYN